MSDDAFPLPGVTSIQTIGDWENFFHPAFGSGVIPGAGSELVPSLDTSGRNIVIQSGAAIVRAFYKPVSTATYTPIPAASSQNRIDRLVLRLNRAATAGTSFVQPVVITGTPAPSPQVPAVTQTSNGLWDLPIAHWTSASNGSLTGLVDERAKISSPVVVMPSTAGEPSLDRASLLIQPDTGNLLVSPAPGAAWKTVWQDDSWKQGGNGLNGWTAATHPNHYFQFRFAAPGLVVAEFSLGAPGGTSGISDGTQILADPIPAAYWPPSQRVLPAHTDYQRNLPGSPYSNNESSCLRVDSSGIVTCWGFSTFATFALGGGVYTVDAPY